MDVCHTSASVGLGGGESEMRWQALASNPVLVEKQGSRELGKEVRTFREGDWKPDPVEG